MRKIKYIMIMCCAFCVLFTACGKDDKDTDDSTTTMTTSSSAVMDETSNKVEIEISTTTDDLPELPVDKPIELPFVPVG